MVYMWVMATELERVKRERNIPLFAQVYKAGERITARGSLPTAIHFIMYVLAAMPQYFATTNCAIIMM